MRIETRLHHLKLIPETSLECDLLHKWSNMNIRIAGHTWAHFQIHELLLEFKKREEKNATNP